MGPSDSKLLALLLNRHGSIFLKGHNKENLSSFINVFNIIEFFIYVLGAG